MDGEGFDQPGFSELSENELSDQQRLQGTGLQHNLHNEQNPGLFDLSCLLVINNIIIDNPQIDDIDIEKFTDLQQLIDGTADIEERSQSSVYPNNTPHSKDLETNKVSANAFPCPDTNENIVIPQGNGNQNVGQSSSAMFSSSQIPKDSIHGDILTNTRRQNKTSTNSRNVNQELRMKGECYVGYRRDRKARKNEKFKVKHDVPKPARSMKPPCTSSFCKKSRLRTCDNITEEQRKHLFTRFWKTMDKTERKSFICSHVSRVKKKITKNPAETSRRTDSRTYFLTVSNNCNNTRYQVCKKMFLDTLGIQEWTVRYWLENAALEPGLLEPGLLEPGLLEQDWPLSEMDECLQMLDQTSLKHL